MARGRRTRGTPRSYSVPMKGSDERVRARLRLPAVPASSREIAENQARRPRTREECRGGARPCPWVGCKHHLYLDVNPETGSIKLNFPDVEPWELAESCSLDVADRGGITLEEIGLVTNLTRERIRQVEVRGLLALGLTTITEAA